MNEALISLKNLLDATTPLPQSDWEAFASIWKPFSAKRKVLITTAGQIEKHLYFVQEGVQRIYYFDEQNREATLVFTYAPSFGGILDSLLLQAPSKYYYETLTPSVFLKASQNDLLLLSSQRPAIANMIQEGTVRALSGVLERQVELQCFTSEDKFKKLLQRSPHILHLVPHKYLANYIGVDPTNFSKMIHKIRI